MIRTRVRIRYRIGVRVLIHSAGIRVWIKVRVMVVKIGVVENHLKGELQLRL